MISPTMNVLLQSILITIFLTSTAIEFVDAYHQCPNFTAVCTDEERPGDCPDDKPCCRVAQEEGRGDVMICLRTPLVCPDSWFRSDSQGSICSNKGLCCQQSSNFLCVCLKDHVKFEGERCQYKRNDGATQAPPRTRRPSTKQQDSPRDYTTRLSFAETTSKDQISTARESSEQAPATSRGLKTAYTFAETASKGQLTTARESIEHPPTISIGLTTLVVVIVVAVLLCVASVAITGLIFRRKCGSVATGIKSGNTDAEKKYQNLRTTHLNGNGDIDNYDTLELYDKGYETIDDSSTQYPNYTVILDSEYLDVRAEADDYYDDTAT